MIIKLGIIANSFTVCLFWISDVPERGVDTFHPWLDTEGNCTGRCGLRLTLVPLTADWGPCESLRLCCDGPRDWSVRSGIETVHVHMVNHMAIMVQNLHVHIIITNTPIYTCTSTLKTYKFDIVFSQAVKHFAFLKRIFTLNKHYTWYMNIYIFHINTSFYILHKSKKQFSLIFPRKGVIPVNTVIKLLPTFLMVVMRGKPDPLGIDNLIHSRQWFSILCCTVYRLGILRL